jgi:hypothetical protein
MDCPVSQMREFAVSARPLRQCCHFPNYSNFSVYIDSEQPLLSVGKVEGIGSIICAARFFLQHTSIATCPRSLCSSSGTFFPVFHAGEMATTERR